MAEENQNDGNLIIPNEAAENLLNEGKTGSAAGSNGDGAGTADDDKGTPATGEPKVESDADKWKKLSRQNEKNLRDAQAKLKEFEDKGKSETQRLQEAHDSYKTQAEKNATELARMNMAAEHAPEHATLAQLRKVAKRLRGDTPEELEADAKELWEDYAPAAASGSTASTVVKPAVRLKGGADPSVEPDEMDPRKIVANIPRAR
jgi:hypothetical protein